MVEQFRDGKADPHYNGYFHCFNRQEFYEAHDVLENLWLADKYGPNGNFYKGLIQLAGAFVHLQKNRLRPAAALFKLAENNLNRYPAFHESLDIHSVLGLIAQWVKQLESGKFEINPFRPETAPQLVLQN